MKTSVVHQEQTYVHDDDVSVDVDIEVHEQTSTSEKPKNNKKKRFINLSDSNYIYEIKFIISK
ncbi:hypothetical protein BLOT_015046 [Blomia tropicalis]|nr:hypothetical protein BLOT_015046 [Blomia tropicalis]